MTHAIVSRKQFKDAIIEGLLAARSEMTGPRKREYSHIWSSLIRQSAQSTCVGVGSFCNCPWTEALRATKAVLYDDSVALLFAHAFDDAIGRAVNDPYFQGHITII